MAIRMFYCFGLLTLLLILLECSRSNGEAIYLNKQLIEEYKTSKKLILLNFYADWCRFSSALKPIYDKAADQISQETNDAVLGKVDCERDKPLCQHDYHINKYPTIKIIRNGELIRKEYRGQRTTDALVEFVRRQTQNPIELVPNYSAVYDKVVDNVKAAIGFFPSNNTGDYQVFNKVAFSLKDDCKFFAIVNSEQQQTQPQVSFREAGSPDQQYNGEMSYDSLHKWLSEHCIPLVREITFQNGEELTEEGLPFLILFYHPDHTDIKTVYRRRIEEELMSQKGAINFLTADGIKFAHPLSHLGKSKKDLPVLAIDSFRHMYVFPNFEEMHTPGKLKQFIDDLHSGKLHREFHYGPDAHQHHHGGGHQHQPQKRDEGGAQQQQPPESTFKKLHPGKSRYSLVNHDEL